MEIPGISTANQALTLVGSVAELVKKGATIELQTTIVSLKEAILELKDENLSLKEKVSGLEAAQSTKERMKFEEPNYYLHLPDGSKDGPFCQVCYDAKSQTVRLQVQDHGAWRCQSCGNYFQTAEKRRQIDASFNAHNQRVKEKNSWMA